MTTLRNIGAMRSLQTMNVDQRPRARQKQLKIRDEDVWNITPVGLALLDRKGRIVKTNRTFRKFSPDTINPYFQSTLATLLQKARKSGRNIINREINGRRGLHSARPDHWLISLYLRRVSTNVSSAALLMVEDISERKRLQNKVLQVVDSLPNIMVVSDGRGKIIKVSAQAERLFGYTEKELLGKPVELLIPRRKRAASSAPPLDAAVDTGFQMVGLHRNGFKIPIEVWINPIQNPKGMQLVTSIKDLTPLRDAEARTKEGWDRFRVMADAMPVIVFMTGADQRCTYANKEGLDFFGVSLDRLLGSGWADAIHPDDRRKCVERPCSDFYVPRRRMRGGVPRAAIRRRISLDADDRPADV